MPIEADGIRTGDYLTPSLKFAREHALTTSVYHGEDYGVFVVLMGKDEYREASNPGEYIYIGEGKPARLVGIAKYNDEYADSEYQRVKLGSKETLSPNQSRLALLVEQAHLSKNFSLKHNKQKLKKGARIGSMVTNNKGTYMLKELTKIANELDQRGLSKEADALDELVRATLIKEAYSWREFKRDFNLLSNQVAEDVGSAVDRGEAVIDKAKHDLSLLSTQVSRDIGSAIDKGEAVVDEAVEGAIEGAKAVGRDVEELYHLGVDKIEEGSRKALSAILDNPDIFNALSLVTKIGAAGAIAFPATAAPGLVALRGSAAFDILAAIGYFNKGENISGWASIVSAVVFAPAGLVFQVYKGLMLLKNSGSIVILSKAAPAALISAFIVGLEVLIEAIEGGLNELSKPDSVVSEAIKQKQAEPGSVDQEKIKSNMETSGRELLIMLNDIKSDLSKA